GQGPQHGRSARRDLLRRILLARVDARLHDVLLRRQRAGRELAERARRVVCAVEVDEEALARRRFLLDVEEAPGSVRGLPGGVVLEDDEKAAVLVEGVELVSLALQLELDVAAGFFIRDLVEDV